MTASLCPSRKWTHGRGGGSGFCRSGIKSGGAPGRRAPPPRPCRSELRTAFVAQADRRALLAHGVVDLLIERVRCAAGLFDLRGDVLVARARELRDLVLELLTTLRSLFDLRA